MKRIFFIALATLACIAVRAQSPENIYSVTACPDVDASTGMRISWAADTTVQDCYVLFTEVKDRKWRKAVKVVPEQKEYCTVFDGISSKAADGTNFIVRAGGANGVTNNYDVADANVTVPHCRPPQQA